MHLASLGFIWCQSGSLGVTRFHLVSLGFTWTRCYVTWCHSVSLGFTWCHLVSLGFTGFHWVQAKGQSLLTVHLFVMLLRDGRDGSNGGDGIKNYYTPIWYALHDSSAHFTGMLYPYGDNYVFADAQPLLASALGWYHNHVQPLSGYDMVAVLNLAMLFGVVLCALLMYQLLRENNLPWLYSLVAAIVITLMSPQRMLSVSKW